MAVLHAPGLRESQIDTTRNTRQTHVTYERRSNYRMKGVPPGAGNAPPVPLSVSFEIVHAPVFIPGARRGISLRYDTERPIGKVARAHDKQRDGSPSMHRLSGTQDRQRKQRTALHVPHPEHTNRAPKEMQPKVLPPQLRQGSPSSPACLLTQYS